uniref:Zinc finger protein 277 n=1 Tax=Cyprinus carpio TaxID=7962 RepID=A0A8C1R978_CYPCA
MVLDHKLVIADVKLIADFPRYMLYWKKRFTEQPITDFCSVIKTNSEGPVENRYPPLKIVILFCPTVVNCLYCEKTFRDKTTLKDHMRKKQHRRINARNQEYDRFYVINYLELGKTWEEVQSEDDREIFEDEDDDWSDWQAHPVCAVCLFCEQQAETMEKIYTHMEETHEFDLHKLKTDLSLKFYQQVKLVNYIRRELHQCRCYCCQEKFETKEELVQHLVNTGHVMQLPEISHWDQPQYDIFTSLFFIFLLFSRVFIWTIKKIYIYDLYFYITYFNTIFMLNIRLNKDCRIEMSHYKYL